MSFTGSASTVVARLFKLLTPSGVIAAEFGPVTFFVPTLFTTKNGYGLNFNAADSLMVGNGVIGWSVYNPSTPTDHNESVVIQPPLQVAATGMLQPASVYATSLNTAAPRSEAGIYGGLHSSTLISAQVSTVVDSLGAASVVISGRSLYVTVADATITMADALNGGSGQPFYVNQLIGDQTLKLQSAGSNPYIAFHNSAGTRIGFVQVANNGATYIGNEQGKPIIFLSDGNHEFKNQVSSAYNIVSAGRYDAVNGTLAAPAFYSAVQANDGFTFNGAGDVRMVVAGAWQFAAIGGRAFVNTPAIAGGAFVTIDVFQQYQQAPSKKSLKNTILPIAAETAIQVLKQIQPSSFYWNRFPTDTDDEAEYRKHNLYAGFIAEDIATINSPYSMAEYGLPERGETDSDDSYSERITDIHQWEPKAVKTDHILATTVTVVQNLLTRIEQLERVTNEH